MARLVLRGNLEVVVARMARERVDALAEQVEAEAQRRAPHAKVWITMRDERVRPAHFHADGQTIPANLHYQLRKMTYVHKGRDADGQALNPAGGWKETSGYDLARAPRDPALPADQRDRCRCESQILRGAISRRIRRARATVKGGQVSARVSVRFTRIAEAEFGTSRDVGIHFMRGALNAVAARMRS